MEEEQKGKFLVGNYLGRKLTSQNKNPTGNAGEWKCAYKCEFQQKPEDKFTAKVSVFDNCTGFASMVEGQRYSVGYNESEPTYNEKAGKKIIYKTAFWIGEAREDIQSTVRDMKIPEQKTLTAEQKSIVSDLTEINSMKNFLDGDMFQKGYLEVVPCKVLCSCGKEIAVEKNTGFQSVNHMVGTYIATYYPTLFNKLIGACKLTIEGSK